MRDLRDPQKLGEHLLETANKGRAIHGSKVTLTYAYDLWVRHRNEDVIPDYPQDELLSTITAKEYQQELEEKAAKGDRYAKSMLERGEPGDEPVDI